MRRRSRTGLVWLRKGLVRLAAVSCAMVLAVSCSNGESTDGEESPLSGGPGSAAPPVGVSGGTAEGALPDTLLLSDTTGPANPAVEGWSTEAVRVERPLAGAATVTGLRAAAQDGFDRLVIEFAGPEMSGYSVEILPGPLEQCGSGDRITLAGEADLMVRLHPAQAHNDIGRPTVENRSFQPRLARISEVRLICDFEGYVDIAIGMPSAGAFRVTTLREPTRLIVDFRN